MEDTLQNLERRNKDRESCTYLSANELFDSNEVVSRVQEVCQDMARPIRSLALLRKVFGYLP